MTSLDQVSERRVSISTGLMNLCGAGSAVLVIALHHLLQRGWARL